jgi:cyclopropane fatty-acyl-phospholipid synthase-like methyltransferase
VRAKLSVLRASHRVLKPGGRIAYYTIYVVPDLSEAEYRQAIQFWPSAGTARREPAEMLASAGFVDVNETDVTKQYRTTTRAWLNGRRRHYDDLAQALGATALDQKIGENEFMLKFAKDGLVRRSLLTARRA